MSKLTQEKIDVLDKLYNIKGEKSVVTEAIKAKIEKKESDITTTSIEYNNIVEQQIELERELQVFVEQTDKFLATFSTFDNMSFASFQAIGIDLALGDTLATLRQKAPGHEDNLEERIRTLKKEAELLTEKIAAIEEKKEEFIVALNSAEEAKEKLNDLIEDILRNDNDAYPRKYVKDVLENLCYFTAQEISMLEFLILFKEEGLVEYDESYATRGNKFEENINIQDEVMLTGDIFTEEEVEDEVEEDDEPVFEHKPIDLSPANSSLKPVTQPIEESQVENNEDNKEPVIAVEENENGIFAEEQPVSEENQTYEVPLIEEEPVVEENPVFEETTIEEETTEEYVSFVPEEPITAEEQAVFTEEESELTRPMFEMSSYSDEPIVTTPQFDEVEQQEDPISIEFEEPAEAELKPEVLEKIMATGINIENFNDAEKYKAAKLIEEADEKTINMNFELLRSIYVSDDAIYKVHNVEVGAE